MEVIVVVVKLLQWFEDLEILFLESSKVPFKKKCSFSHLCCRKTEALTPVHIKWLEMRNQVMNKPLI